MGRIYHITRINGNNLAYLDVPALANNNMISLLHTKARRNMGRNVGVPFLIPEGDKKQNTSKS